MVKYVLGKKDAGIVYFKYNDRTGFTFTSSIRHAMVFDTKDEAMDYNNDNLYGECEVFDLLSDTEK